MATPRWKQILEPLLSLGAYPEEPETKRGGRRVLLAAIYIATVLSIPPSLADLSAGYTWVAIASLVTLAATPFLLVAIWFRPRRFATLVTVLLVLVVAENLLETTLYGGLVPSGLVVMFLLDVVLAALVGLSVRAAMWWFAVFVLSVAYAVVITGRVDPRYVLPDPTNDAAFNLLATGVLTVAVLIYFVRQRDRFQQRSDDLLHNILPDEIAEQLKGERTMIADDFDAASVLFADVVDFTPMSAGMSPTQLVGLLDEVFSVFDGFVAELGLEKIKTIGDAYMVAAGVPVARSDHARAIAELALRIRDHAATNPVDGRPLSFRIGIHSGPVTAGIIGTHKFSYDLWGDTVNVASRMESGGVPGAIQISAATRDLIEEAYVCEPRGLVPVKGKDEMEAYLLVSRRATPGS
jgi:guanylate cyclase